MYKKKDIAGKKLYFVITDLEKALEFCIKKSGLLDIEKKMEKYGPLSAKIDGKQAKEFILKAGVHQALVLICL